MKYTLTDKVKVIDGVTLHRIKALRSFGNVNAGDLGGWVEKKANLSQDGDAWVYGDAWVFGDARVSGDAWVAENAKVYGDARVFGDAWVYGNAKVYGDAWVCGDAWLFGDAWVSGDARVSEPKTTKPWSRDNEPGNFPKKKK